MALVASIRSAASRSLRVRGKRRRRTPMSSARACSSQVPLRVQERQSSGWFASMSSTAVRRAEAARSLEVETTMPSAAFCTQARARLRAPATSTTQTPQEALAATSGSRQSVGTLIPAAAQASTRLEPSRTVTSRPSIFSVTCFSMPFPLISRRSAGSAPLRPGPARQNNPRRSRGSCCAGHRRPGAAIGASVRRRGRPRRRSRKRSS